MLISSKVGAMKVGAVFKDGGFTATTTSESVARDFVNPIGSSAKGTRILMRVVIPKGARAANMANFTGTGNAAQKEVLLPRGSKFKIKSVKSTDFTDTLGPSSIKKTGYIVDVVLVK